MLFIIDAVLFKTKQRIWPHTWSTKFLPKLMICVQVYRNICMRWSFFWWSEIITKWGKIYIEIYICMWWSVFWWFETITKQKKYCSLRGGRPGNLNLFALICLMLKDRFPYPIIVVVFILNEIYIFKLVPLRFLIFKYLFLNLQDMFFAHNISSLIFF